MVHEATRVTIIAERLLESRITDIINKAGASGYTLLDGSGKGQHGRHLSKGATVINSFSILKIEFVVLDRDIALAVADEIEKTCFDNYSGIVYLSRVEILRKNRF
jgi:nitrogen regulatory protein PII